MCSSVFHLGPVGSGTVAKLMNNLACFTLDQVIAECLTIGVKAGVDPQSLFDALKGSALGKGGNINVRLVETFMRSDFEPRFTLAGAHKDLSLAVELADNLEVPLRISPTCPGGTGGGERTRAKQSRRVDSNDPAGRTVRRARQAGGPTDPAHRGCLISRRKPFVVSLSNHEQRLDPSTGSEPAPCLMRG